MLREISVDGVLQQNRGKSGRRSGKCGGLLLPIADGPPDGAIWAYFLGKAEQLALELDIADEIEPF